MALQHFDIEFDKHGRIFDQAQLSAIVGAVPQFTDLIVMSHGWNNDMADARALYDRLIQSLDKLVADNKVPGVAGRKLAAVRIFWPSKRFTDEELIPGGGAASAAPANDAALVAMLERLKNDPERLGQKSINPVRAAALDRAKALIPRISDSEDARREFVDKLRAILNPDAAHKEDASLEFFTQDADTLFDEMSDPVSAPLATGGGGAAGLDANEGGAAGLKDMLGGVIAGARRLVNFTTYYEMKERAGTVGRTGVTQMLTAIRQAKPDVRLHLVGHSFGGRLVTAAANELPPGGKGVTMTLLQAAYSHNGLAVKFDGKNDGAYRRIVSEKRVPGPIVITHTKNDKAVGIAYPLASRIALQNAAAFGDENDPYGGMGRNGAQHTPEAKDKAGDMKPVGTAYPPFGPGGIYNLRADAFIKDHNDVTGFQVAYALLTNIAAG